MTDTPNNPTPTLEALKACKEMIDVALPCFDWGKSALSAEAIQLLNETPGKISAALLRAEVEAHDGPQDGIGVRAAYVKARSLLAQPHHPTASVDDITMILERMLDGDEPEKYVMHFAQEIAALTTQQHPGLGSGGPTWLPTHRHVKRGTEYEYLGWGRAQCSESGLMDDEHVAIYRGEDGSLWARRLAEFNDGRFAPIPTENHEQGVRGSEERAGGVQ